MDYIVLLYYKFIPLPDAEAFFSAHRELAQSLNLKGRILIGQEGINGTVAGELEQITHYKEALWADPRFTDLVFKESKHSTNPFPKLKVKLRKEVISLHTKVDLNQKADYIQPKELQEMYENGEEFYIFDARNNYESSEGAFAGAITPDIANFRDLPKALEHYADLKDKKLVTYCTGGIRCEKASALFKEKGFSNVYQLEGGIVNYILQYPNQYFEGDCYIFDDRMRVSQEELAKNGSISQAPPSQEPQ